jgi:hypothetical protein
MALQASQIDCKGCGAKVDIHAGLRTQTFVCEYCGSVNEGEQVTAVQDMQSKREQHKPWSHLRLGMKATLLGHEYQIIGRMRAQEKYWWWDEWILYSETGFPIWLQEGEGGFTIFRVYYPTYPINPWTAGSFVKLDNKGGNAQVRERGNGEIVFLEGEFTWSAKPGEQFNYLEAYRGKTRYSIEYTEQEIQFLRGETRDPQWVYNQFGIQEAVPPPLTFDDPDDEDDDEDWDEDSDQFEYPSYAKGDSEGMAASTKVLLGVAFLIGVGLLIFSAIGAKKGKLHKSVTFPARAATSKDNGVLVRGTDGNPLTLKLPKVRGAYELRLASSSLGKRGIKGGKCWWTQVDFLKERSEKELKKIEAYLRKEGEKVDQWARYQVVHRVNAWFGRYWGIDEGERWNENEYVRAHYFRPKDPGPYYLRVYANNCSDYKSRRSNPVKRASLTVAIYKGVWMTRWTFWAGIVLVGLVVFVVAWRLFSDD